MMNRNSNYECEVRSFRTLSWLHGAGFKLATLSLVTRRTDPYWRLSFTLFCALIVNHLCLGQVHGSSDTKTICSANHSNNGHRFELQSEFSRWLLMQPHVQERSKHTRSIKLYTQRQTPQRTTVRISQTINILKLIMCMCINQHSERPNKWDAHILPTTSTNYCRWHRFQWILLWNLCYRLSSVGWTDYTA